MTSSTRSGGDSRRTGRGQCGQAAAVSRAGDAADAALGHVALDRAEPVDSGARRAGAASRSTSRREIGRGPVAGQSAFDRLRPERLDPAGDEAQRVDAEAGLDRLDLRARAAEEMGAVAGRAGGADGDCWAMPSTRSQTSTRRADGEPGFGEAADEPARPPRRRASAIASAVAIGSSEASMTEGGSSGTTGSSGSAARPSA